MQDEDNYTSGLEHRWRVSETWKEGVRSSIIVHRNQDSGVPKHVGVSFRARQMEKARFIRRAKFEATT